jgi:hypothetical protein
MVSAVAAAAAAAALLLLLNIFEQSQVTIK